MSKYIDLYNQKKKTAAGAIEMDLYSPGSSGACRNFTGIAAFKRYRSSGYYIKHLSSDGLSGAA